MQKRPCPLGSQHQEAKSVGDKVGTIAEADTISLLTHQINCGPHLYTSQLDRTYLTCGYINYRPELRLFKVAEC